MKVVFLAGASSIHTVRWVNALSDAGVQVVLATQHETLDGLEPSIRLHRLPLSGELGYFRNVAALKRLLAEEQPDLLNAHYASGYGTLARLSGFGPYLLAVWGSDIYDFPKKSALHRWWMRGNLMAADKVASTSHAMAEEARLVAPALSEIAITPFGVDTDLFVPTDKNTDSSAASPIVIGTVKTLRETYGIDSLIKSFGLLRGALLRDAPAVAQLLRLRIVGEGPQKREFQDLVAALDLTAVTSFEDRVPHDRVPTELGALDIYVALSRRESFGVAVIEASACGLPVVVSDVGGLPEVVANGETGFVVPGENPEAAADALRRLVLDPCLRHKMGQAGRERVVSLYEWRSNVRQMISLYERAIADKKRSQ